jgi:hypothetical protein
VTDSQTVTDSQNYKEKGKMKKKERFLIKFCNFRVDYQTIDGVVVDST